MHSQTRVFFRNYEFFVPEDVYNPAEDSFLFAENLKVDRQERVVDIGTGCGILAIVAAATAREVVAVDINPFAVQCSARNAALNGVTQKMSCIQGDLLSPIRLEERFDLIMFNAPYLPSDDTAEISWLARAWSGGVSGRDIIERFIVEAPQYLRLRGRLLLMQSTLCGLDKTLDSLNSQGFETEIIARRNMPFFETIVLIMSRRA